MAKAPEIEHLLDGIKKGDQCAFETLVRTMTQPLFHYAGTIVRDSGAAEEVVQNTFIRVFKNRRRISADGTLRGYCYRIATNLARNHLRDRRLRREREQEAVDMREQTATDPQNLALAQEAWELADRLPHDMRATLHLRFGHGLTLAETAVALDVPEGTVSTRQRSGLQRLRDKLALTLPVIPGPDQLGDAMVVCGPNTVDASPGLLDRVEVLVMASIAGKSISNLAILALVAALLMGGVAFVATVAMSPGDSSPPINGNTQLVSRVGNDSRGDDASGRLDGQAHSDKPVEEVPEKETVNHKPSVEPVPTGVHFEATIRGRVVDSSGEAVVGAAVESVALTVFEAATRGMLEGSPAHKGTAATGPNGAFELLLSGTHAEGENCIYFALSPVAEGLVGLRTKVMWIEPETSINDIELTLFRTGQIEGRVVLDSDRSTPVAGVPVSVSLTTVLGEVWSGVMAAWPVVTSDEDGAFTVPGLPPGNYSVRVDTELEHPRLAPYSTRPPYSMRPFALLNEGDVVKGLELPYYGTTLRFRTEPPVESVSYKVDVEIKTEDFSMSSTVPHFGQSTGGGAFELHGIHAGVKSVSIEVDGFVSQTFELTYTGDDVDLGTVNLNRGLVVRGVVVNANGIPVGDARVGIDHPDYGHFAYVQTEADGSFHCSGLEALEYSVTVTHSEYALATATYLVSPVAELLEIVMHEGGAIVGTVTIGGQAPTPRQLGATGENGIVVRIALTDGKSTDWANSKVVAMAGPRGNYRTSSLTPGMYTLEASSGMLSVISKTITVSGEMETRLDLDIGAGAVVTGTITDRDGNPASGIRVYLTTDAFKTYWKIDAPNTVADKSGQFRFQFVAPGAYYVRLESDQDLMGSKQLGHRAVTADDGETTEIDIDLSAVAGPVIRGRATVDGHGLFKEVVLVEPDAAFGFRTGTIDDKGYFELTGMEPGSYYLWFADSKWSPKLFVRQSVEISADEVIEINRDYTGCKISGRVVIANQPEGFDFSEVKVQIKTDVSDDIGSDSVKRLAGFKTSCDEDGSYSWNPLIEGPYLLVISAPGFPAVERRIDISRDAMLDVVVDGRAGEIQLNIENIKGGDTAGPLPTGSPLDRKVMLKLFNSEGSEIALETNQQLFDLEQGESVKVGSLLPGTYVLELSGSAIEPATYTIDVVEDETVAVPVTLWRGAEIHIKVLNEELNAADVQSASIEVYNSAGTLLPLGRDVTSVLGPGSDTAARKIVRVNSLLPGAYRIVIKIKGYSDSELAVQVERSSVTEREVTLSQ